MNRKKLLFVITKSNYGGAQKYIYDLATHLPPEEFDVSVAAGEEGGVLFEKLQKAGIHTFSLSSLGRDVKLFSDIRAFFHLYRLFKRERPDIIHLNSSKAGFTGALAARCLSVVSFLSPIAYRLSPRIVFTAHGWAFNEDRPAIVRAFFFVLSWKIVALSHLTIAVSRSIAGSFARIPFAKNKFVIIPHGISRCPLLPQEEARKKLLGEKAVEFEHVPWIGTIAELHPSKDIDTALRALHLLPDLKYVYVVIGEGQQRAALERKIQYLDMADKVFLVGFRENAPELLSAFDVFLLSSTTEAFGYVVAEALQAGVPVVATAAGGVPEVVSAADGRAEIVPPKDYRGLAAKIKKTLENKGRIEVTEDLYPLGPMIRRTTECYRNL